MSKELKKTIDEERGEVSRSKYICKIIEKYFLEDKCKVASGHKVRKTEYDSQLSSESNSQH